LNICQGYLGYHPLGRCLPRGAQSRLDVIGSRSAHRQIPPRDQYNVPAPAELPSRLSGKTELAHDLDRRHRAACRTLDLDQHDVTLERNRQVRLDGLIAEPEPRLAQDRFELRPLIDIDAELAEPGLQEFLWAQSKYLGQELGDRPVLVLVVPVRVPPRLGQA